MATETQLRFNLDVPPIPKNLASNFQPQPSPVVIDKPPDVHPCVQTLNASTHNAFSERLALAIKLAKRDLRKGLIRVPSHSTTGEEQVLPPQAYPSTPFVSWRECTAGPFQTPVTRPLHPAPGADAPHVEPSAGDYRLVQPIAAAEETRVTPHVAEHTRHYPAQLKQVTDEIIRLRKELTAEVKKLKQLKMGSQGAGVKREVRSARPLGDADFERHGWEAKEDEEGRLKRKVTEQTARNTRMLYDLQQQVNELQKDTEEKPPHVRHTKKSLAMHRLAAAHRAILGTLQSHFSACVSAGCGRALPAELALLVERLVLLGAQLHIDGGQGELLEGIKDLGGERGHTRVEAPLRPKWNNPEDLMGHTSHPNWKKRSPRQTVSSGAPPTNYPVRNKTKKPTRSAHLSASIRQKPTYSNRRGQMFSHPTGRESSVSPPSLLSPSPLHNSQARSNQVASHVPVVTETTQWRRDKGKGLKSESISCATQTTCHEVQQGMDGRRRWVEPELQVLNSRLGMSQQPQVKTEGFIPQESAHPHAKDLLSSEELSPFGPVTEVQPTSVSTKNVESSPNTSPFGHTLRKTVCDTSGKTTGERTGMEIPSRAKHQSLQRVDLQSMLSRLEECEAEEQMIRQRWTSLAYEDPFHQIDDVSISHQPSSQPLSIPAATLASIQQYQAAHEHYLELTGIRTTQDFDPWKLVESIADELLEEQLELVTAEIADMCDKCVDGLYSAEFAVPKTIHI